MTEPCCDYGPTGHTEQEHHDASACFEWPCPFDHPYGGPYLHPCDRAMTGPQLAEAGIAQAALGADEGWLRAAKHVVWELCREQRPFTTDSVWYRLEVLGVTTREGRALGAVMRAAQKAGFLQQTGEYSRSTRPECHARPLPVWAPTAKAA